MIKVITCSFIKDFDVPIQYTCNKLQLGFWLREDLGLLLWREGMTVAAVDLMTGDLRWTTSVPISPRQMLMHYIFDLEYPSDRSYRAEFY